MPRSSQDLSFDRVLVCDGAMGTMIHAKGVALGSSFDDVNVSHPEVVEEIHCAYVEAGAEIIETNTFGANRLKLDSYGFGARVRELNLSGTALARKCAGDRAFVAGSVGPTGRLMQPFGPMDFDEAFDVYREQMSALCEGGVDLLVIETIQDLREAKAALLAAKSCTEIPIVCQMSFSQEGRTMMGASPDVAAVVLSAMGVRLVGTNCSTGPQDMLDVLEAMASVTDLGLAAQPNAGLPRFYDGRLIYLSTPEYMADFAKQFADAGAVLVGGCCGTTPDHIRAIASAVAGIMPAGRMPSDVMRIASRSKRFDIGAGRVTVIGNRLGAGASSVVTADIKESRFKLVQDEAEGQFRQGADVILIDCDMIPEPSVARFVELVQTACSSAVYLIGSKVGVLESALRAVEGRASVTLRGSVSSVIESLLPVAKRHGAAVIARTDMGDGDGSPEERLRVSARIVQAAEHIGLRRTNIAVHCGDLFDAQGSMNQESLRAIKLVTSDLRVPVVVDCASSGAGDACPGALQAALDAGADLVIADPADPGVKSVTSERNNARK
jgi:5-methyltetrahydrofolate--homocysteine methyltransferase